ncbi:aminotransferase class V-fold PLP-dependent enzyme [Pseudovibrio sp. Ad13]|uniref:aminotransferase class V-fold PLP-dependent enzyme n=1 Tax=Pseudovibrio sp. Ad13 TaxID=989396 RepID=UPI0009EEF682|nr:aminotransferase class V-fold PLP-dependent enzyme [Pseudovibrio sp. Ad13]
MKIGNPVNYQDIIALDDNDPLKHCKELFEERPGVIHLDANSLGSMPKSVPAHLAHVFQSEWADERSASWAAASWMARPMQIGAAISRLIGAAPEDTLAYDNTTLNLFKLLTDALKLNPDRQVILSETTTFPTNLHVAQGLENAHSDQLKVAYADPDLDILDAITEDVAVVYLSQVDYRSGRRFNMEQINTKARSVGALTLWDLSHSAGAIPLDVEGTQTDFAVGCGYKYLCGGPGGPAWLYINKKHQNKIWPEISGWIGHANIFSFSEQFEPAEGVLRHMTGSPQVIANEIFWCAAEIWNSVDPHQVWAKHRSLSETLVTLIKEQCGDFGVQLASPENYDERGGHVCVRIPGDGSKIVEALKKKNITSSFRSPNAVRFGLSPLYHSHADLWEATQQLRAVLEEQAMATQA